MTISLYKDITHIKSISYDDTSWCGETIGIEFHFKDAEHAALHGVFTDRAVLCPKCVDIIKKYLDRVRAIND